MLKPVLSLIPLLALLGGCQPEAPQSPATDPQALNGDTAATATETEAQRAARLQATFPAQQRPPQDPAEVALGLDIYAVNCRACHGQDLRGGDLGGPNLLRSEVVLADEGGDEIGKVVREGRSRPGATAMPPLPLDDREVAAVAAYIHSIVATGQRQGAPPPGSEVELNIVVGDAQNGQQLFRQLCSSCHSVDGDLAGLASRIPDAVDLQNSWVSGRASNAPADNSNPRRTVTVSVTLDNGESISGRLVRHDDFLLSLVTDNGNYRSFTLNRGTPAVSNYKINDPLARHLQLMGEISDDMMHDLTAYLVTLK